MIITNENGNVPFVVALGPAERQWLALRYYGKKFVSRIKMEQAIHLFLDDMINKKLSPPPIPDDYKKPPAISNDAVGYAISELIKATVRYHRQ